MEKCVDDQDKSVLVSIITVCLNAEKTIEKTLRSVLEQTYNDIEYIVKDGGSVDKTNIIIEKYRDKFHKKGIRFLHIIKKDQGIYDAMNYATDIASGKYINYMNADDTFFDQHVLQNVFGQRIPTEDVLYGDSVCEYEFIKGKKEYTLWKGQHQSLEIMPFSHQACFLNADLIKQYHYDTRYHSAADYQLLSRFWVDGKTFYNIGRIISICSMEGVSNIQIKTSYRESIQIKQELKMIEFLAQDTKFKLFLMEIKQWILNTMPYSITGRLLRLQVKRKGKRVITNIGEFKGSSKGA